MKRKTIADFFKSITVEELFEGISNGIIQEEKR